MEVEVEVGPRLLEYNLNHGVFKVSSLYLFHDCLGTVYSMVKSDSVIPFYRT